jgi:hypothetical protein
MNKSILVMRPDSDQVMLFVTVILDAENLDLQRMLTRIVMEMARTQVQAGLLLVGDSTLVLRHTGEEILVDEVNTADLMSLAGLKSTWDADRIVLQVEQWIAIMARKWQNDLLGPLRKILVPEVMSGIMGTIKAQDGIWGVGSYDFRMYRQLGPH